MNPKMTAKDAATLLGTTPKQIQKQLIEGDLPYFKSSSSYYFGYATAKYLFDFKSDPKVLSFQIVKGGTGKTSLASCFAIRANLCGLRVLCIDLDQQGNLTQTFDVDADLMPVMIDILAEGYSFESAITRVAPGLDLLASRIENALLDDVIKMQRVPLDKVYASFFAELKQQYDLIVVDCPPNLGQSVAAVTLAVDKVVAPVVAENYALSGLKITCNSIRELQESYNREIPLGIVLNKYDGRTNLSQDALRILSKYPLYRENLLETFIRTSQEFPNALARGESIYDTTKVSIAKTDIDKLTCELLQMGNYKRKPKEARATSTVSRLEAILS